MARHRQFLHRTIGCHRSRAHALDRLFEMQLLNLFGVVMVVVVVVLAMAVVLMMAAIVPVLVILPAILAAV